MGNFRYENRSRDNRDDRGPRRTELHDAVCDDCGKNCKVPFRPTSGKPIFCSECFDKKGGGNNDRPDRRDSRGGDRRDDSPRPPYVSLSDPNISRLVEKIDILNSKLDQIIDLANSIITTKEKPKKAAPVKKVIPVEEETSLDS